ncbi:CCA tRNA nucleotidyltransferase [Phocicoccus pinnipedialis]|nr:CCA tRNA nucleotidyltransferase [Jeotgalicoccus pinnipedialis]MBP1939380.1 tRNA nucleotidyltransferase (CCA-adding enzyme) [Jeotgalicoccus pinnipedialis]
MNKFDHAKFVLETLETHGFDAYFVGGSVRDFYMGREIHDVDVTTNARPDTIKDLFKKTIDVGIEHGTVIVLLDNEPIEVTTYRTETSYTDHRRPDSVSFTTSLLEDLSRRDFTMNAIAMDKNMNIVDPFDGHIAIKYKRIETVGIADERFNEDALRMLRAVRFISQLDFTLTKETENAIRKNISLIKHVSIERIVKELKKLYEGKNVNEAKKAFVNTNMYMQIPFFNSLSAAEIINTNAHSLKDEIIVQHIKDRTMAYKNVLKLSNKETRYINNSLRLLDEARGNLESKRIAYKYSDEILDNTLILLELNPILDESLIKRLKDAQNEKLKLPIKKRSELKINGRILMEKLNKRGGPWLQELLSKIEGEVIMGRLMNNEKDILEWVKYEQENYS